MIEGEKEVLVSFSFTYYMTSGMIFQMLENDMEALAQNISLCIEQSWSISLYN